MEQIENGMLLERPDYHTMTDEEFNEYMDYIDRQIDEMRGK